MRLLSKKTSKVSNKQLCTHKHGKAKTGNTFQQREPRNFNRTLNNDVQILSYYSSPRTTRYAFLNRIPNAPEFSSDSTSSERHPYQQRCSWWPSPVRNTVRQLPQSHTKRRVTNNRQREAHLPAMHESIEKHWAPLHVIGLNEIFVTILIKYTVLSSLSFSVTGDCPVRLAQRPPLSLDQHGYSALLAESWFSAD